MLLAMQKMPVVKLREKVTRAKLVIEVAHRTNRL